MRNGAIAAFLLVTIVSSAGVVYFIGVNRTPSPVSSIQTGFTTTEPCGSPGVICGGSKILNDSLATDVYGSTMLTLTVQNTGYGNLITSLQISLNDTSNTVVGSADTHLKSGNQTTVGFLLSPNQIQVSPGKAYSFVLSAWDGASTDSGTIFTVVASQQTITTTTTSTTNQHYATPVSPNVYVNGQQTSGAVCFNVPALSQVWNVAADFPWKLPSTSAYPPPVMVDYSFAPFPLGGTIPAWLHLSMQPPAVALANGQNSTASLQVTLDSTVQKGAMANFALHANYNDPFSGYSVVDVVVLGVVANGSSSALYGCSHPPQ